MGVRLTPYVPRPPLDRYVEIIWRVQGTSQVSREKVLPNGAVELIINLGSPHLLLDPRAPRRSTVYRESWLAGIQERFVVIEAVQETDLIGIRFRPGGAYAFLGLPMLELTNRVVEWDAVLDTTVRELRERLLAPADPGLRIALVERFLLERLETLADVDPWLPSALDGLSRGATVSEISRRIGISPRHLARRFHTLVGLRPKLLSRIFRLQRVIQLVHGHDRADWVQVALRSGYSDQAHMHRDFRLLVGATPTEYLLTRDADENHIAIA